MLFCRCYCDCSEHHPHKNQGFAYSQLFRMDPRPGLRPRNPSISSSHSLQQKHDLSPKLGLYFYKHITGYRCLWCRPISPFDLEALHEFVYYQKLYETRILIYMSRYHQELVELMGQNTGQLHCCSGCSVIWIFGWHRDIVEVLYTAWVVVFFSIRRLYSSRSIKTPYVVQSSCNGQGQGPCYISLAIVSVPSIVSGFGDPMGESASLALRFANHSHRRFL